MNQKIPKTFYCHHTIGGDTYIEKKPLNIKKILYKNNPYGSGWESEFNSFYDTNSDYDVIFANTDFKVDNDNRRYLMIWADVFEDPLETAIKLGQTLVGKTKIQKKTKSMVFLTCELTAEDKIVATASGVWKILSKDISKISPNN